MGCTHVQIECLVEPTEQRYPVPAVSSPSVEGESLIKPSTFAPVLSQSAPGTLQSSCSTLLLPSNHPPAPSSFLVSALNLPKRTDPHTRSSRQGAACRHSVVLGAPVLRKPRDLHAPGAPSLLLASTYTLLQNYCKVPSSPLQSLFFYVFLGQSSGKSVAQYISGLPADQSSVPREPGPQTSTWR